MDIKKVTYLSSDSNHQDQSVTHWFSLVENSDPTLYNGLYGLVIGHNGDFLVDADGCPLRDGWHQLFDVLTDALVKTKAG